MGRLVGGGVIAFGLWMLACAPKAPAPPWVIEPRPTAPEIRVLPVVDVSGEHRVDYEEAFDGLLVPWDREETRRQRTRQLREVPHHVATALPGEVQVALGDRWEGRFRVGRFPMRARDRVAAAVRHGGDPDAVLAEIGRARGWVLVTWVIELDGEPLSKRALPDWPVDTPVGPVVVDLTDEPYLVRARVGTALVAADGEVVLRMADDVESILSSHQDPAAVGRDLARGLAESVAAGWPADPRLGAREVARAR